MKLLILLAIAAIAFASDRRMPPPMAPGVVDRAVTQANIKRTICRDHYTDSRRPSLYYTNKQKAADMKLLRLRGEPTDYEEDHRVPLEVGGDPEDPGNLWPQIWPEARLKDRLEKAVSKDVCDGTLTLKQGQAIFLGNFWIEYDRRFGQAR